MNTSRLGRGVRGADSRRRRSRPAALGALTIAAVLWAACDHDPYTIGAVCHPKDTVPCYSGPAGTEGVGACKAGYRECNADLEGFGACKYEVTPGPETCATPADDDCNGQNDEAADCQCKKGDTEPCYDGPDGTQDVGLCKAGEHACGDGLWGTCNAQVLPATEDCTNLLDEDCDGVACAAPLWGLLAGDAAEQRVTGVATDSAGNVYVSGYFGGTIDFGGAPLQSKGGADAFVARLDTKGKQVWSRSFATPADEVATAVAVTADGGVIVAGYFTADLTIGNTLLPNNGLSDAFVTRLDAATGDVDWAIKRGYAGNQRPAAIAVTATNGILVAGAFSGFLDCPGGACGFGGVESAGGMDAFLMELGPDGTESARRAFGGPGDDFARAVVVDGAGHALVAGDFVGSTSVGGKVLIASAGDDRDAFVATFALGDLAPVDAFQLGDGATQTATAAAWTGGALVLAGTTEGVVTFELGAVGQKGSAQGFVARLGDSAATFWARAFSAQTIEVAAVAAGGGDRVALTGTFGGSLDFGTGVLTDAGGTNAFLLQLGPDGAPLWAKSFGKPDAGALDEGSAVAVASNGVVVFGGGARSVVDFGLGDVPAGGGVDAAVACFWP
jgi:hypothetical protein